MGLLSISTVQAEALSQFIYEIAKVAYMEAYKDIRTRMEQQEPRMYTRKEVAERLGVSLPTVHALMNQGILKPVHVGRKPLFRAQEVEEAISTGELRKYKRRNADNE